MVKKLNNREERSHSQSFSCIDKVIDDFDFNSKNFEVIKIKLKIVPRIAVTDKKNLRSIEIRKLLEEFNRECENFDKNKRK